MFHFNLLSFIFNTCFSESDILSFQTFYTFLKNSLKTPKSYTHKPESQFTEIKCDTTFHTFLFSSNTLSLKVFIQFFMLRDTKNYENNFYLLFFVLYFFAQYFRRETSCQHSCNSQQEYHKQQYDNFLSN